MKNRTLQVIYDGAPNPPVDSYIRRVLEEWGFEWYGQGYNIADNERDMVFDWPKGLPKTTAIESVKNE